MCESMNKTLKYRTDYKEQELHTFVEKMCTFTQAQENLLPKAVIRSDCWPFYCEYKHLEIHFDKWFMLSEKAQQNHMKKVLTESLGCIQKCAEDKEEPQNDQDSENRLSKHYH